MCWARRRKLCRLHVGETIGDRRTHNIKPQDLKWLYSSVEYSLTPYLEFWQLLVGGGSFHGKKNRITNQPGCSDVTGQDQHAENIQKDNISPEEVVTSKAALLQWNREEIPQKCLSHSRSSQLSTSSESSTLENVEKPSVSEIGDEGSLTELHFGNNIIGALEGKPHFQETLISSPLERSKFKSAQERHCSSETMPKEEMVRCKDMKDVCIIKYPEACTLNTESVSAEDCEISGKIDQMRVLEKMSVLTTESMELWSMERGDMAITFEGAEDLQVLVHVAEVQSSGCTEILPLEQDIQKSDVRNMMAYQTECSSNVPVTIIEENVKCVGVETYVSSGDINVTEKVMEKVMHSDFSDIIKMDNDGKMIHLGEESVHSIQCGEIASNNDAGHLVKLETSLQETECIANPSLDAFEQIVLCKEKACQPPIVTDIVLENCIAQPGVHEKEVCTTEDHVEGLADKDALIKFQEKTLQSSKALEITFVEEGHHTNVRQKTSQAAQINESAPASKVAHSIIEVNTSLSIGFIKMNTVNEGEHSENEKVMKSSDGIETSTKEGVNQLCVLAEKEIIKLEDEPEITSRDVRNNLFIESNVQPTKFTDAELFPQTLISEENLHPAEMTKFNPSTDTVHNVIFERNVILHSPFPVIAHKDPIVSSTEEGSFQTAECNATNLADKISRSEFSKNHSSGKDSHISAIDVGLNINALSSADNAEESIVVGMLMNSYVDSSPLLTEENVCQITAFSQCLGKAQHLAGTDTRADDFQKAKETDNLKRACAPIEQMAMRIVSQVILAATKEILSDTVVNVSGINCHVLENQVDCSLGLENGVALPPPISGIVNVLESNRQTTIAKSKTIVDFPLLAEESQGDDNSRVNTSKTLPSSCPEQVAATENNPKCSVPSGCHEPNVSVVSTFGVSFEETSITAEDSGCSACTSEDGLIIEEPLQSTTLSSIVSTAPHFDTSEIGDTITELSVTEAEIAVSSKLRDKNVLHSNGELKNSPDLKQDAHWSKETEVDHSGGSDVNSMDSVDSGCPLGKTESHQEPTPGLESKKSDLTVWEIEVPKHLVGRLIGKQGRYVSFLKQTSGAKIYISTLPYTQEFQICHIEGSQLQVDKALNQIGKKFKELNLINIYAPPPLTLPSLPMTSWLMLPDGVTVEVIVVNVVNAGHLFVQQHTHPTFHALRSLDQQMFLCYSQPGIPVLPTPVEVGVICAAPGNDTAWWRAQVVSFYKDSNEVEIRYVDYGGYERVKLDILRQIRSDFVTLPFQGSEVLLDNVIPLPDEDHFSSEADVTVNEMTRGTALLAQVTNYDGATGLPLIQLWSMLGEEVVSINRALVDRGFAQWIDGY